MSLTFDGANPLAAVSVGNLDTAKNVTWLVGGMGTNVKGDIKNYTGVADSLKSQQDEVTGGPDSAVIAWFGYHPPAGGDMFGEMSTADAEIGSGLLAYAINGLKDTRNAEGGAIPSTAVVAHSYATIMAAMTMKDQARVDYLVFEGSPGIPTSVVSNVNQLQVGKGVYVTQATHDGWAVTGQVASTGRVNPVDPSFGSHVFSSDGNGNGVAVDNHGPYDDSGGNERSYWNSDTQAFDSVAKITGGQPNLVPIITSLPPKDEAAWQWNDFWGNFGNEASKYGL